MDLERTQEVVVLTAALFAGIVLAVVDPELMPEKMKFWALALGRFRQSVGVGIVLVMTALIVFR